MSLNVSGAFHESLSTVH